MSMTPKERNDRIVSGLSSTQDFEDLAKIMVEPILVSVRAKERELAGGATIIRDEQDA